MDHSESDFSALYNIKSRRKIERKNKKKLKATCRLAYAQHKKVETLIKEQFDEKSKQQKKREKRRRQRAQKRMEKLKKEEEQDGATEITKKDVPNMDNDSWDDENLTLEEFLKEAERLREERLKTNLDDDDLEIKRLEAKLRKNKKRRTKTNNESDEDELEKAILGNEEDEN